MHKIIYIYFFVGASLMYGVPPFISYEDSWAYKVLNQLSLREKIGQLFVVAALSNDQQPTEMLAGALQKSPYKMDQRHVEEMIEKYHAGGIIFLFKSEPQKQLDLMRIYQKKAQVPLMILQDAEWGLSMRLDTDPTKVVRYPRNMTLGAIADEHLVYKMGYEVGMQCAVLGVHCNCAPVCDVNNNPKNPVIHDRSFGDDPERVARLATLFAQGLQAAGVISCGKHYPGHGDTDTDSHLALPLIKHKKELETVELVPFKKLIQAGVGALMNAHLAVPAFEPDINRPSSLSYTIVTKKLKNELDFKGLVVTDGLGMKAITKHYQPGKLELEAFLAGNDILLGPLNMPKAIDLIEQAIERGQVMVEDLNQRVLKILKSKKWSSEQQQKIVGDKSDKEIIAFLVRPEAYTLQEKLYRKAITLAKSNKDVSFNSELCKQSCIIQIGALPEDIFAQACKSNAQAPLQVAAALSNEEVTTCLNQAAKCDRVIITLSELHKNAQSKYGIADNTLTLIQKLKKAGKKITIIVFGTPYSLKYLDETDIQIVAYEDAQPAQRAVVDVLCGTLQPTGKLPIKI